MLYIGLGLLTGMILASQGAINGRMAFHVGGPLPAALVSFSVGWLALVAVNFAVRSPAPAIPALQHAPWWAYLGGLIGAVAVASAALSVPRIGVAAWVSAVIAGQLISAVTLDHIGAFGQVVREVSPLRLLGVALLAAGVVLIRRF